MDVQTNLLMYEDYLLMPEIHQPCEIIQGELLNYFVFPLRRLSLSAYMASMIDSTLMF
jgi:hypothetical protein